jgi:hypothetical protein
VGPQSDRVGETRRGSDRESHIGKGPCSSTTKVVRLFGCRCKKAGSGGRLRSVVRPGKRQRQCASRSALDSSGEMSGAWPAYRKLSRGRSRDGTGNRVRERVLDSRAKPAGVSNDHRRRRGGNASCDQLKKRPPVGDPRKLYRFSSRGCWWIRFTVARRRSRKASKTASSVPITYRCRVRRTGGASRRFDRTSKTSAKSQYLGVAESRREPALQSPADTAGGRSSGGSEVRWNWERKFSGNPGWKA